MLQLNQLRCFVAVATELHFGRAAAALNMTQPPLTRQIQVLEHELGVDLFERNRRFVRLTPAGRAFLREATDILQRVQEAELTVQRASQGEAGSITLSFIPAASYSLLPSVIGTARKALPGVDLAVTEMQSLEQIEALTAGRIDLGFVRPMVKRPELDSACLLRERFIAAVPAEHPLAARETLTIKDLDQQDFIMYSPAQGRYSYELLVGPFRSASISPRYVQYMGHAHTMLSLVSTGMGLAIVPESAARLKFDAVTFRPIHLGDGIFAELHMVWRRDNDNIAASNLRARLLPAVSMPA